VLLWDKFKNSKNLIFKLPLSYDFFKAPHKRALWDKFKNSKNLIFKLPLSYDFFKAPHKRAL